MTHAVRGRRSAIAIASEVGEAALAIDAKNETVAQWHKSFGGLQLLDESLRLIMPLSTIADVVEASLVQGRS